MPTRPAMTDAQISRQAARDSRSGQYRKHRPCECCGKSAGAGHYTSAHHGTATFGARGLQLCGRCCTRLDDLDEAAAWALYQTTATAATAG